MTFNNSVINIRFTRTENIKKKYIMHEEILNDKFNEASILPIPDDAPAEIPRIIIKSKGEHSQINIAPEAVNLQTVYSDDYLSNWNLCENYTRSRAVDLLKFTDTITEGRYDYIGVVVDLVLDEYKNEGNKVLYKNLFGKQPNDTLEDLVVKYTFVEDEKYYVNLTLQSVKIFEDSVKNEAGNFSNKNLKTHTIVVTIDINDRYSYNTLVGYNSAKDKFEEIMTLMNKVINERLHSLVEQGEYK